MLALLLSAALIAEPTAGCAVAYAAGPADGQKAVFEVTEDEQNSKTKTEDGDASDETGDKDGSDKTGDEDGSDETADKDGSDETGDGDGSDKTGDEDGSDETGDEDNSGETGDEDNSDETGDEDGSGETGDEDNSDETGDEDGSDELVDEDGSETEDDELTEEDEENQEEEEEAEDKLDKEKEEKEKEEEELDGFSPMPSGYKLTSEQKELKADLAASMDSFDDDAEGSLYVEREVFAFADSREEAEAIAEAYHAELTEYDLGVATLKLTKGTSVGKALRVAADSDNNLPAVYPNYYRYISTEEAAGEAAAEEDIAADDSLIEIEEEEYETEQTGSETEVEEGGEPSLEAYEQALQAYSDPYLAPSSSMYQWQHVNVGSVYAWQAGYTGSGVKVAVLDSGVTPMSNELTLAGNAYTSSSSSSATDGNGHGTHVAGIIGAKSNSIGGAGIAPNASIYNVKVMGDDGTGTDDDIIRGLTQAIKWKVNLINMSLGGVGDNPAFQDKINEAYKNGIAVFAAAGNDGGSNMDYPAGYDHVICIGAVDNNNERASFSNYGAWVDLSAPGVNIWSTGTSGTSYVRMSGTSMACPVAVGEAAVILSANPSAIAGKSGGAKVDALESFMKANAVSAGSGMGKGVTSLTKAFKLTVATAKPAAPTITASVAGNAQSVSVTIKATGGTTIYYATDGKAPTYKNGKAGDNTLQYTGSFSISGVQKGTIQAIAVNGSGVSSAVKKVSFTLKPYVTGITISGVSQIAKGKSSQLTAEVLPDYAANKNVTWSIKKSDGSAVAKADGVTISAKGKVTVAKTAKAGSYKVTAAAQDGSKKSATYTVTVIDSVKIASVKFTSNKATLAVPKDTKYDLGAQLDAKNVSGSKAGVGDFKWTSSNTALATVDSKGVVTPKAAGSVKITATANDASGKKATCSVKITQQVTKVTIEGDSQVGRGKKLTLKAAVEPANATNKKVTWSITKNDKPVTKADGVSISASGAVSATATAAPGTYKVTATAVEGSGKECTATKTITVKTGVISSVTFDKKSATIYRTKGSSSAPTTLTVKATLKGSSGYAGNAYKVTSSNEGIATASATGTNGTVTITVKATGKAAGKTVITLETTDGSKKKATCAVTVNNPVSRVNIAPKAGSNNYVSKGKNLVLKATLETEYGTVSNKNVTWAIYDSSGKEATAKSHGVSVSGSGTVTATKTAKTGTYTVKATAKDGSGAKGSYSVYVVPGVTDIFVLYQGYPLSTKKTLLTRKDYQYSFPIGWESEDGYLRGSIAVTSSNPKVMSGTIVYVNNYPYLVLSADGKGSANITIQAQDGSGKQTKYKFQVK